jgi:hypothetical protein
MTIYPVWHYRHKRQKRNALLKRVLWIVFAVGVLCGGAYLLGWAADREYDHGIVRLETPQDRPGVIILCPRCGEDAIVRKYLRNRKVEEWCAKCHLDIIER